MVFGESSLAGHSMSLHYQFLGMGCHRAILWMFLPPKSVVPNKYSSRARIQNSNAASGIRFIAAVGVRICNRLKAPVASAFSKRENRCQQIEE